MPPFPNACDLYQCAFKQVIKSTAGQAGSGTQEAHLTLLIAHSYESPVKEPRLSGSTYGVVWRGATARGAIERAPDSLRDMTAVGRLKLKCLPG